MNSIFKGGKVISLEFSYCTVVVLTQGDYFSCSWNNPLVMMISQWRCARNMNTWAKQAPQGMWAGWAGWAVYVYIYIYAKCAQNWQNLVRNRLFSKKTGFWLVFAFSDHILYIYICIYIYSSLQQKLLKKSWIFIIDTSSFISIKKKA